MPRSFAMTTVALATVLISAGCKSPTAPSPRTVDFVISVEGELFTLRTSHPDTIRLAEENMQGRNSRFPIGPLRSGDGGSNAPWSWHLDPDDTRLVEVAIELCDGRPSYVEEHRSAFTSYCPWGARVVARR